jgi:ADP-ribose pyrophosphatase YjhB (NUDIX family)
VWASPGGGVELGESDEHAVRRELAEESGLRELQVGPCIWTRTHWFLGMPGWAGQTERHYLVRTEAFEPAPEWGAEALVAGDITGQRWWTPDELDAATELFAPRRLPELVADLRRDGPPPQPIDV